MKTVQTVLTLAALAVLASTVLAGEPKHEKKPPKCPAAEYCEKALEGITLNDDQKAKLADIQKEFGPKLTEAKKKLDVYTPDQKKARKAAGDAAKTAGKKGKEFQEAVDAAVKLDEAQKTKLAEGKKEVESLQKELREKVMGVLNDDQKAQLQAKKKGHGKKEQK